MSQCYLSSPIFSRSYDDNPSLCTSRQGQCLVVGVTPENQTDQVMHQLFTHSKSKRSHDKIYNRLITDKPMHQEEKLSQTSNGSEQGPRLLIEIN